MAGRFPETVGHRRVKTPPKTKPASALPLATVAEELAFLRKTLRDLVAGPRADGGGFVSLAEMLERRTAAMEALLENTTLVCIATNASLAHHQLQRIAVHAHDALARVIVPAHTFSDGDTVFAIGMGGIEAADDDPLLVGMLAIRAVEQALLRSVRLAASVPGFPSAADWRAS